MLELETEQPEQIERLPAQDLAALVNQQHAARIAALQAQLEEAKLSNVMLSLRLKHKLGEADSVNTTTGIISRAEASRA